MAEAFDALAAVIRLARNLDETKFPALLPKLRDQVLMHVGRFLTDGSFSDAAEEVFTPSAVKRERFTTSDSVELITAFLVVYTLDAAIANPELWPEFDALWEDLKRIVARKA